MTTTPRRSPASPARCSSRATILQKNHLSGRGESPKELIKRFRTDPMPRIAVTVDMVATGTDIRPVEALIFMRDVKSEIYYEQMKGRGVRIIRPGSEAGHARCRRQDPLRADRRRGCHRILQER